MSNNLDITIYDFENICRTCLSREDLKPLYEKCFLPSTCLVDMLMSCTIVKFTKDDGLPAKICTNCVNEINQAISFAKRCETTDTILRKCVNNTKSQKVEPIIKAEEEIQIEINPEIILANMHRTEEVLGDYEFVGIPRKGDVKIENEYDAPTDKSYESNSEKSDNPGSTNSQIEEECSNDEDDSTPAKRSKNLSKTKHYECKKCFEKFTNYTALKKHREEAKHSRNANKPSTCPVCNKMVGYQFKRHMRTHTGEKPYCCEICGESFSAGSNLRRHKLTRHSEPNDRIYQCQTCEKSFKRLDMLKVHQRIHSGENKCTISNQILSRDFQCTECDRAFTAKKLLQQHSVIHGEKKFWCSVCGKGFVRNSFLVSHAKVHADVRPYACQVCGKAFIHLALLKRHELIHTGEKPYVCSVCSKAFIQPTGLKFHMRIHTGEKPYSCEVCGKSFCTNSNLTAHKRTHTTRPRRTKFIELIKLPE